MMAKNSLKKWLKRILVAVALVAALSVTPYFGIRAFGEMVRAIDGRYASPQEALSALTVYPHGGFTALISDAVDYEILQRQVLRYASNSGILYALGWQDESGKTCIANAFVERIRDSYAGWKGRGAWGHCRSLDYTGWVSGRGEYHSLSVANGLSREAALVKVSWYSGDTTFTWPINGVYMSSLDRHGVRASKVEFLDDTGRVLHSLEPYG